MGYETDPHLMPDSESQVGGLTDGFMFAPIAAPLAKALDAAAWSLVQVQLSSSYQVGEAQLSGFILDIGSCRNFAQCMFVNHWFTLNLGPANFHDVNWAVHQCVFCTRFSGFEVCGQVLRVFGKNFHIMCV